MLLAAALCSTVIVYHDRGGRILDRIAEVAMLRQQECPVEIVGTCMSSCTLYLGLERVCVVPEARITFHGPWSTNGHMSEASFDRWSEIMARHYPEPLARWFLEEGRYGEFVVSGEDLIVAGISEECP